MRSITNPILVLAIAAACTPRPRPDARSHDLPASRAARGWVRFMPQSTYLCVRLPDGQVRATAYGVGGDHYSLQTGRELAHAERDALCTNNAITVLGARGQLATTAGHNDASRYYSVDIIEPRARSLGLIAGARCFVDERGALTCMTDFVVYADRLADLLNQRGPIDHMIATAPCAVYRDGQVACVTENGPGQVIPMWDDVEDASVVNLGWSQFAGCAVTRKRTVSCLGHNAIALRGFTDPADRTPVEIPGLTAIDEVAVGGSNACARRGGQVWCWGEASRGQSGKAARSNSRPMPRCVVDVAATEAAQREYERVERACSDPNRRVGPDDPLCRSMVRSSPPTAIFKSSTTPCDPSRGESSSRWARPARVEGIDDAIAIATDGLLSCALRATGKLTCWGAGVAEPKTIAFPARTLVAEPAPVPGTVVVPPRAVAVEVGARDAIVTGKHGQARHLLGPSLGAARVPGEPLDVVGERICVRPWGSCEDEPVRFPDEPAIARLTQMMGIGCVLRPDGILRCGASHSESSMARAANALSGAGAIVEHAETCARYVDDSVRCTGREGPVTRWASARSLSGGRTSSTTCAVTGRGEVQCFGDNTFFQRGDEGPFDDTPVTVTGLPAARQVATSGFHTCALGEDGSVWCWGRATQGQLGPQAVRLARELGPEPRYPDTKQRSLRLARPTQVPGVADAIAIGVGREYSCAVTKTSELVCWGGGSANLRRVATPID